MDTPLSLRQLYGDVIETATLARILLDPVANKLSGDPSNIHRRCVIGRYLDFFSHPDDVRDDLAPFGAIEAVAVCDDLSMAVVVFWTEASVVVALQRQAETPSPGWFDAVPPLDAAVQNRWMMQDRIKAALYPPIAATGTSAPPPPPRPLFWFRNSPHEPVMAQLRRDPGTTWFTPSRSSRARGPVLGADGHLWMDGLNVIFHEEGSIGFWIDPACIRVAPLNPPGGDPPTIFVPLFSTAAAIATCAPQSSRPRVPFPAATAMVNLINLRKLYGELVETATIASNLLAPVESQLSGDPSNLHRRCVFGKCLDWFSHPDPVRDDLAPFGAIEAVAVCEVMNNAVIVFWTEASVAVALGRQGEVRYGRFTAVPPLDTALPLCFFPPSSIQAALYPQAPATATRRRRGR